MCHRHALGEAGCTARVEQLSDGVLVDSGVSGQASRRKESLVFDLSDAVGRAFHDYETRLGRQLRNHGLDERLEVLVEETTSSRHGRRCRRFLWIQPDVDRVEDRACLEHAVVRLEQLMGVVGDEADPIARRDAETRSAFASRWVRSPNWR